MKNFNPRHFMEQAIDAMRQSIAEPRPDGKVPPRVGAILVHVGDEIPFRDRISRAYRGELREGDHAEYTLLERKNRDQRLDECVLFATLEPCAPGARNHPKLGCSERIVLARIKEVWVGIEDPDPTVDRKGIKYLQDKGIKVHMFDRDLQEIIRKENQKFIDQALERKAAVEKPRPIVVLSDLESLRPASDRSDLSEDALREFHSIGKFSQPLASDEFNRQLELMGVFKVDGGRSIPTGFGMLLFGRTPRVSMPQAGLLATIHYADGREETKDFDGPQVLVPDLVLQWLRDKLPNVIDRSRARRSSVNDSFFELVREGVVNALVHRDYNDARAKCQLVVRPSSVEIRSPGEPVPPITLEQMQSFNAPMLSRNPLLHFVFSRMELAEERGLGLKSMKERAQAAGLPLPRYSWTAPYLVLTLYATPADAVASLPESVLTQLTASERDGWKWVATRGHARSNEYAKAFEVDVRTARRHLKRFEELRLVKTRGSGPSTEYVVEQGSS